MALRPRAATQPGRPASLQSPKAGEGQRPRASSTLASSCLEEELSCPVCCEIFRDPVVLHCSHSFCKACLQRFWRRGVAGRECPVCRRRSSLSEPPVSLALKNVAETFLRQHGPGQRHGDAPPEALCSTHGEPLRLFCQDHQEALCFVCHTSKRHRGHQVCPLEEAASELREELKKDLGPLKKHLRQLYTAKQGYEDIAVHIKNQTQRTEKQIKEEFEQLHQFLQKEEAVRVAALREENERKSLLMKTKIETITREILSLSHVIIAIDNEVTASDALFLQKYKDTKKRVQCTLQEPEVVTGALINVAQYLGSLKYRVWEKMLGIVQYTPVTLDPNTAYAWLSLSEDLTSVTNSGAVQEVPDNAERFDHFVFVLGADGWETGQHAWEVEVVNKADWLLGVAKESISRKGKISGRPEDGCWTVSLSEGQYTAMTTPRTPLALRGPLEKVRVQLDLEAGEVSFSDPLSMTAIYTFRDRFTEKMFPFFCPGANINGKNPGPLKICPVKVAVWNSATW